MAVERALLMVGSPEHYALGSGDYKPGGIDVPFTDGPRGYGSDCWGFAGAWCYQLPRHRPGFNHGAWATVADDINTDSAIEDGEHKRELFEVVDRPALGDLLVFSSVRSQDHKTRLRIGHVGIVVAVCAEWDVRAPQYGELTVVQCQASKRPSIIKGPGMTWLMRETFKGMHDVSWRSRILRLIP